jgi:hypothetical protein
LYILFRAETAAFCQEKVTLMPGLFCATAGVK